MSGTRWRGDKAEQEKGANRLRSLRAGHADDHQETRAEQPDRHPTRYCDCFIKAGEQKRSRNEGQSEAGQWQNEGGHQDAAASEV